MTDQPEASATYEVHGIDEEPTLTWTAQAAGAGGQPVEAEGDEEGASLAD